MRLSELPPATGTLSARQRRAAPGLEELEPRVVPDGTVSVDPSVRYQTLEGWGTSLAWWANVVGGFPDYARNDYINKIFDPVNGLGLTVARYNIGGGENPAYHFLQYRAAVPGYEPAPGVWDWTADANQRWVLQAALASGVNQLEAFSNSPPYWMTNSGSVTGAVGGGDNLNSNYYGTFADYLTQVVQQFADSWGITFQTLEPLNEPSGTWWSFGNWQEGCHFDRGSQDAILQDVGASLAGDGVGTTMAAPDENSIDATVTSFNSYGSATQSYLSQINTHSYAGSERTQLANQANSYSKDLWMSEYGDNDATGLTMSRQILDDMKNLRPTAWVYWQAVDSAPGWGFLKNPLQDEVTTAYTINEKYYVMGNYSRFIRPGYQFIAIDDANSLAAYDAASGTLVIVTTNSGTSDTSVTYDLSGFSTVGDSVTPYRTSASEQLAQLADIGVSGAAFTSVAKAHSVTTYVLSGVTDTGALGFDPSTYYELVNRNSGLVLDVTGASTTDGTPVIQWYGNGNANQQWAFIGLGGGYDKVVSRNSGLLLDVSGESLSDGASVIQWHDHDGTNQHWRIAATADGYYQLINQNSGLLLDVSGGSTQAGANVVQWHDDAGASQQWSLVQVTSPRSKAATRMRGPDPALEQAGAPVEGGIQTRGQMTAPFGVSYFVDGPLGWDGSGLSGNNSQIDTQRTPTEEEAFLQPAGSMVADRRTRPMTANLSSLDDWAKEHDALPAVAFGSSYLEPVHRRWNRLS